MKKKFRITVSTIIFLVVAILIYNGISAICRRSTWPPVVHRESGYYTYSKLNNLTSYPIDIAAFGSSLCACSFAALELYEQYGMSAYNIGGSWQPVMVSYFLLQKLLETEKPKVVLLEANNLFVPWHEDTYRLGLDGLPISKIKIEAIKEHCKDEDAESQLSYILNLCKYHFAWKNLKEYGFHLTDPKKEQEIHQGYRIRNTVYTPPDEYVNFQGWTDTGTEREKYDNEGYTYICKFIELCQRNGIDIILYQDYVTNTTKWRDWTPERHNATKDLADFYGIPYIDFNMKDVFSASGCNFSTDLADENHDNLLGAIKVTRYLGEYLHANYDLPDHRGDPTYADLDKEWVRYQREKFNSKFVYITNLSDYLDHLQNADENYTAIISVRDEAVMKLDDELKNKLRQLDFESDFSVENAYHKSFIGIWQDGKVIYENLSKGSDDPERDILEFKGIMPDSMKYYVKSAGYKVGNESSIVIDGVQMSKNGRGMNIVIYDIRHGRVIDSIVFDTHKDAGITYKR